MTVRTFTSLTTFWTCHSWEDFPTHFTGDDAASLLVAWTSLWHPEFLAGAQKIPEWRRIETVDEDFSGALITLAIPTRRRVSDEEVAKLKSTATVIESAVERERDVLAPVLGSRHPHWCEQPWEQVVKSFFALGYTWMQIQLMTRQLRYSSTLDSERLTELAIEGAQAAVASKADEANDRLQAAFDLLLEERNRYYPVTANLLDLTLVFPVGISELSKQLSRSVRQNWLGSATTFSQSLAGHPELTSHVRGMIQERKLELAGGHDQELPLQLVSQLTLIKDLTKGKNVYQENLGSAPVTYARRLPSLAAGMPQMLERLGFKGALHLPFAAESHPYASAPLFSWQSPEGTQIPSISGPLLDASRPETFLKLGVVIGEQVDSYHSATVVLAHWPAQYHWAAEDMFVANQYGEIFGRFRLASEVFDAYYNPGYGESFEEDDYRWDYLSEWVQEKRLNPISRVVDYWRLYARWRALGIWTTLIEVLQGTPLPARPDFTGWHKELCAIMMDNDQQLKFDGLQSSFDQCEGRLASQLVELTGYQASEPGDQVVFNGSPAATAVPVAVSEKPALITIPAWGYSVVSKTDPVPSASKSRSTSASRMIEDGSLQNDFFRVDIDQTSGAIRGVKRFKPRAKNLLSQQLAWCQWAKSGSLEPNYSKMVAKEVEFKALDQQTAVAESSGDLVFGEHSLARYRQVVTVRRGFPDIHFAVDIEPLDATRTDAWNNYFCVRWAWASEAASRWRTVGGQRHPCRLERFSSPGPILIDIEDETILFNPQGLAFHRQSSLRTLDTLLITNGERQRHFEFCVRIASDELGQRPYLPDDANLVFAPAMTKENRTRSSQIVPRQAQFFQIHPASIELLEATSVVEGDRVVGVHLLIAETLNQNGNYRIGVPRMVSRAQAVDLQGQFLYDLEVRDGEARGVFHGHQILALKLFW